MDLITPQHINATLKDLQGNQGLGRYLFLTGSDDRALAISGHFQNGVVLKHPRQHNLYLGSLPGLNETSIDVAAISTGMGGPSADIIINELMMLGVRRFLRVGTAGSLQPKQVHTGDLVIALAAVRDDKASWDYIYPEYPAIASHNYLTAMIKAQATLPVAQKIHFGIVHSKSSLFAREMHQSLLSDNDHYMLAMQKAGVLASEMECAQLFILASLMSAKLKQAQPKNHGVLAGAILTIVGDRKAFSPKKDLIQASMESAINFSIQTIQQLQLIDQNDLTEEHAHATRPNQCKP